jgi:hypothetical protein
MLGMGFFVFGMFFEILPEREGIREMVRWVGQPLLKRGF